MDPNGDNNLKNIKIALVATIISFFVIVTGFSFVVKHNLQNDLIREKQISALIDEVGILKDTNKDLEQYIETSKKNISVISLQLSRLYSQLKDDLYQKNETLEKINEAQVNLIKELENKERTIGTLAQKNLQLKTELDIPPKNSDIHNILILGKNGGLTDTILIAVINQKTQAITLVSLPRDLFYKGRKINELYNSYGIEKLKEEIYQISGLYPEKYITFDFESFTEIVDSLGGIDVSVEENIKDNQYPGPNNSYTVVSFFKGMNHMDGETALKYVRSRKSTNDFDRSFRQQQVLLSLRNVLLEHDIFQHLDDYLNIYGKISTNIDTDIGVFEAFSYYDKYKNFKINSGNVISNRNFLYSSINKSGQYILLPINGSYVSIKSYISELLQS